MEINEQERLETELKILDKEMNELINKYVQNKNDERIKKLMQEKKKEIVDIKTKLVMSARARELPVSKKR